MVGSILTPIAYLLYVCICYNFCPLPSAFEERLTGGSALLRPLLPAMSPPESVASYEDDFVSSQGSSTLTDRKISRDLRYLC